VDDAAAIQSALDAAPDGCSVLFPAGTYLVQSSLTVSNKSQYWLLDPGATLRLDGGFVSILVTGAARFGLYGSSPAESRILKTFGGTGSAPIGSFEAGTVEISDLGFVVNVSGTATSGYTAGRSDRSSTVILRNVQHTVQTGFMVNVILGKAISLTQCNLAGTMVDLQGPNSDPGATLLAQSVSGIGSIQARELASEARSQAYCIGCRFGDLTLNGNLDAVFFGCSFIGWQQFGAKYALACQNAQGGQKVALTGCTVAGRFNANGTEVVVQTAGYSGSKFYLTFDTCTLSDVATPTGAAVRSFDGTVAVVEARNTPPDPWPSWYGEPSSDSVTNQLVAGRYLVSAPALAPSDVTLNGWGAGASVAVSGTDQRGKVTVTAGTMPGVNPTVTVAWKRQWPSAPVVLVEQSGGSGVVLQPTWTASTTQLVITYPGTPVAGATYELQWIALG
jgi:hypothetical protein